MKRKLLILLTILPLLTVAQKTDKKLTAKISGLLKDFQGDIGIYIKDLKTGKTVSIHADTLFPTASIVKVPILLGLMNKMLKKELDYNQQFIYKDSLLYAGSDILGSFKSDEQIVLKKLIMLMLTTSDNTASLWLQSIAGTGTAINALLDSLGYTQTRVNSRTAGREENRTAYGWGQTTPYEMASIFESIYHKQLFSPEACDRMMRCLSRNFWDVDEGISQVPPTIAVFSKNGCVNASRNEIMLVNAPQHPYILSIFTKNNKDQSWTHENEAWVLTRKISAMLWAYFGPAGSGN